MILKDWIEKLGLQEKKMKEFLAWELANKKKTFNRNGMESERLSEGFCWNNNISVWSMLVYQARCE